jgi:hypothetical protein
VQLLFEITNSDGFIPVKETAEIMRVWPASVVALVTVNVWVGLVVPTGWFPNARFAGTWMTGATPVPVRVLVLSPLVASLSTVAMAVRGPRADGVKETSNVQLVTAPPCPLQWSLTTAKSAAFVPVIEIPATEMPSAVTVTVSVPDEPTTKLPKPASLTEIVLACADVAPIPNISATTAASIPARRPTLRA